MTLLFEIAIFYIVLLVLTIGPLFIIDNRVAAIVVAILLDIVWIGGLEMYYKTDNLPKKQVTEVVVQDSINKDDVFKYIVEMRIKHPKIVLAQALEESAHFKSPLFKKHANLFGMKDSYMRTAVVHKSNTSVYSEYNCWEESVLDYALWQSQLKANIDSLSDEAYLRYIAKTYAKNPQYVANVLRIYNNLNYD